MDPIHLSIIIPAFNEATRLPATLEAVHAWRSSRRMTSEVIVVDDCSTDGTPDVFHRFAAGKPGYRILRHERNAGKGAAVKTGMLAALGAYRLFTDADNSTPIEEVDRFFPYVEGAVDAHRYDIVIASRRQKESRLEKRQPMHREAAGRLYSLMVRALLLPGFYDTQCGFKMFTARAAEQIFPRQRIPGFGFDIEILYIAVKILGFRVKEAPVRWIDSPISRVRLFQDSLGMFLELLKIRNTPY